MNIKPIRSYVKRSSRLTQRQERAFKELWGKYGLTVPNEPHDFTLYNDKVFNHTAPLIVEIGFGMGDSFIQMVREHPENNYIGIEVYNPGVGKVLAELEQYQLMNARIFHADAVEVFTKCISNNSLDKVQIFFPDPWPKHRHHKRRLIQTEFVTLLHQKLKINGTLHLATDWEDYAMQMLQVITATPRFTNSAGDGNFSPSSIHRVSTKFEKRGQELGHRIFDLIFLKT